MYAACAQSYIELERNLFAHKVPHEYLFTGNESLITRARNTSVAKFLKSEYQAIMFIDADIEFRAEDVAKLWNMGKEFCVGAYPMKKDGDPPVSAWVGGNLVELSKLDGPTKVDYAGSGFMLIRRQVFEEMMAAYPDIHHSEGFRAGIKESLIDCWAFFNTEVVDGVFLSEDYLFCERWRKLGGEIWLDPSINLKHWGVRAFAA